MYVFASLCLLEYCPSPLVCVCVCVIATATNHWKSNNHKNLSLLTEIITFICVKYSFFPVIWLILYDHHDKHNFRWAIPYHSHLCFTIIEFIHYVWILEINSSRYEDSVHFFSSQVWLLLKFGPIFFIETIDCTRHLLIFFSLAFCLSFHFKNISLVYK